MDKTININLGGSLFQVEVDAFGILRDYIQAINNRFRNVPGGPETIEDIESRIAEIFSSQKGIAGVITRNNVESMISTLGKPEDFDTGISEEIPYDKNIPRRLYRNPENMVISGVCGGIGAYLNVDPVLFRVLFVLFTLLGGAGLLIYIVFWIAVPPANTESRKREMYGPSYYNRANTGTVYPGSTGQGSQALNNGFNEIINAIGKVFYIIFRIFLVIIGTCFVLTGFLMILSFVMIFIFKIPGAFTSYHADFNVAYIPDLLQYIFNPASAPWIWALTIIAFMLPMIALIYWGVRMIFWFRVRDAIFNLAMFIIWVCSLTALSILLFNEGVSFAENSSSTTREILNVTPDTLKIVSGNRLSDVDYDEEFTTPEDEYSVFIADATRNLYIKPRLRLAISGSTPELEVRKLSSGRNRREATENAESLIYSYDIAGDSIILDEYFMIPSDKKWTADFVNVKVRIPENTVIYFDEATAGLLGNRIRIEGEHDERWEYSDREPRRMGGRYWKLTDDGLEEAGRKRNK